MTGRWNWRGAARCRAADAEGLFVTGAMQREARQFCRTCPVRTECLAHALDQRIEFGVWGGMTERERRALLRSRPDVQSWAELLADAREAHYAATGSTDEPHIGPAGRSCSLPACSVDGPGGALSAADETAEQLARAAEEAAAGLEERLEEPA